MKTTLALAALFLTSSLGINATAPAAPQRPIVHSVTMIQKAEAETILRGATIVDVTRALGEPTRKLSLNVWAYPHFNGGEAQDRNDDSHVVLITFNNGVVSDIQLVNSRAEQLIAARIAVQKDPTTLYAVTPEKKPLGVE